MFDNPKKELEWLQAQLLAVDSADSEEEDTAFEPDNDEYEDDLFYESETDMDLFPETEPMPGLYDRAAGFDADLGPYRMDEDRYVAPPRKKGFRGLVIFALLQAIVVIALAVWWLGRLL